MDIPSREEFVTVKVNEDVLRRAVTNIELNLGMWDQSEWADECGTTACLAGWIIATETGMSIFEIANLEDDNDELYAIPALACNLLGITGLDDRLTFTHAVFYQTQGVVNFDTKDEYEVVLRNTPEALKLFKETLTSVTGVEF